jgi:hypothetical protein
MPESRDKITIMDVESPSSKEDQNLLLAPWGNNHNVQAIANGESPSPRLLPKSPSSVFSFAPKSPGGGSNGMRYCVDLNCLGLHNVRPSGTRDAGTDERLELVVSLSRVSLSYQLQLKEISALAAGTRGSSRSHGYVYRCRAAEAEIDPKSRAAASAN